VITIDIGGNDAFRPLGDVCATGMSDTCVQAVQEVFTTLSENLLVTLGQLRTAAPGATIVIMTYFNSLVSCDQNVIAPAAELVLEGAPDGSLPGMNDIIRDIAAGTNVLVAEAYGEVGADDLVGGEDCLHPNDDGHQKIATAFASVITGPGPATPVAVLASAARS
jgi:lysophospholipase L1-like esterase